MFVAVTLAATAKAQITLDDFSSLVLGSNEADSWIGATSVSGGVFTVGPNADNAGSFLFVTPIVATPFSATALNLSTVSVTARIDSGNLAPGFLVILFDSEGNGALMGTFATSSFTSSFSTQTVSLTAHPNSGVVTDISYYGIAGSGTGDAFRISFDSVSVAPVPEPSTYATIAGFIALGLAVWRRRAARA